MGDKGVTGGPNVASRVQKMAKEAPFFFKIIELIICVVTIGLIVDPFKSTEMRPNLDHAGIVYVSICGYILINAITVLCYLVGERQPKRMSMVFSLAGGILCFASGIVLIHNWSNFHDRLGSHYYKQYLNQTIASGVFAIIVSIVFVIDAFLTYRYD